MIAADSSSLIAYFNGASGADIDRLHAALAANTLVLPAVVVTEVLTDPGAGARVEDSVVQLTTLPISEGYWMRAGHARRILMVRGFKARVGDALIAQACIDNDVALITRDRDFRHFATHCGLRLA
jgi:predicted nucleic acid-binding protein